MISSMGAWALGTEHVILDSRESQIDAAALPVFLLQCRVRLWGHLCH